MGVGVKVDEKEFNSLLTGLSALAGTRVETLAESDLEVGLMCVCSVLTAGGGTTGGAVAEVGKGSADVVFIGEAKLL